MLESDLLYAFVWKRIEEFFSPLMLNKPSTIFFFFFFLRKKGEALE